MRADVKPGTTFPDYQPFDHWERGDTERFYPPELGWPPEISGHPPSSIPSQP